MIDTFKDLLEMLSHAATGGEPARSDFDKIRWRADAKAVDGIATKSWMRLRHFIGDEDIRKKDADYDRIMREEMRWRWEELTSVSSGSSEPY